MQGKNWGTDLPGAGVNDPRIRCIDRDLVFRCGEQMPVTLDGF